MPSEHGIKVAPSIYYPGEDPDHNSGAGEGPLVNALVDRLPEPHFRRERVSELEADELLYTDDPEADRQAGRAVGDLCPVRPVP